MSQTTVFHSDDDVVVIDSLRIGELKQAADADPLGRARICLHLSSEAAIHEMLIVTCSGSYSRPHRNVRNSKSYFVIEGKMILPLFDDKGRMMQRIVLAAGEPDIPFLCRLNVNCWHTVVAESEQVVFLETNGGPFIKEDEEYADWAPSPSDTEACKSFIDSILSA